MDNELTAIEREALAFASHGHPHPQRKQLEPVYEKLKGEDLIELSDGVYVLTLKGIETWGQVRSTPIHVWTNPKPTEPATEDGEPA